MRGLTGIYIHIPFCIRRCPYCSFYSSVFDERLAEEYVRAVCRNLVALKSKGICSDSIYLGGGTPSVLSVKQVERIISAAADSLNLIAPEITIEANPCTVSYDKLLGYRRAGVNRISFGVQSGDDEQLRFLGRLHDKQTAADAVSLAHKAGFDNISCDIMLGSRGQDLTSLKQSVDLLLSLPIMHISAYMLKIEQGTAFDCESVREQIANDEQMSDLYLSLCSQLETLGYEHYEISSFALNGKRSRHNMKYWTLEPYIGIGASAHSDFGGKRFFCPPDLRGFIAADLQPTELEDAAPDRAEEYIMLAIRTSDGIGQARLVELAGESLAEDVFERAKALAERGLAKVNGERITLTDEGFLLSNSIILHLLGG